MAKTKDMHHEGKKRNASDTSAARGRILKAAKEIFAKKSYNEASTRMVAKQAKVEHPLIHYYFGTKEKLFEAVTEDIYEEFTHIMETWLEGLERIHPYKGLAIFIDRMLDYTLENPEALQIISLNMVHLNHQDAIPGYRYIVLHMARTRRLLEERLQLKGTSRSIEMFIYCFYSLVIPLLGAKQCQAQLLNMDPQGSEYRDWVRDAVHTLFLPWLERLIFETTR